MLHRWVESKECDFNNPDTSEIANAPSDSGHYARRAEVVEAEFGRRFNAIPGNNHMGRLAMIYFINTTVSDI